MGFNSASTVKLFALGCLVVWGRLVLVLRGLPLPVTPDSFPCYSLLFCWGDEVLTLLFWPIVIQLC